MDIQENINRIKSIMGLFKGKSRDDTPDEDEIKRFTCFDCGEKDYDMYMVNTDIWNEYGTGRNTLCVDCLENRMGRKLTCNDFSEHKDALTNIHNPYVQELCS